MSTSKNFKWLKNTLHLKNSILPKIALRVIVSTAFSVLIVYLSTRGYNVSFTVLANIIPSVLLGLLLVFRTNTANERFWEGRKLWGEINNNIRNLSRQIWTVSSSIKPSDKKEFLEMLWLYSLLVKADLRNGNEKPTDDLKFDYIPSTKLTEIGLAFSPALVVMTHLQKSLSGFKSSGQIDQWETQSMQTLLDNLVNNLGGCQRILKTPIPIAYSIHLNQLVLIYCLTLPFQFVATLAWLTIPVVAITSFAVMGIEEIGTEIENPFGNDTNDLPIDGICAGIKFNIDELMKG
jgi:ion channel-forming bestrophin family protein